MAEVRLWTSFSSNNSSGHRLVARFAEVARAEAIAGELEQLLGELPSAPDSPRRLAEAAGFDWDDFFPYGGDADPSLAHEGRVLALFHSYCLGFPPELTEWLRARGAEVERDVSESLQLSVVCRVPSGDDLGLGELFATLAKAQPRTGYAAKLPVEFPWCSEPPPDLDARANGDSSFFCDGETLAMYVPAFPSDVPLLKRWLGERGATNMIIRLCEYADRAKFEAMANARCSACDSGDTLRYLVPERYGVDVEQLACSGCGAMFELSSLMKG